MVYRGGGGGGQPQLLLRRWDDLRATSLRGTEDGRHPAISPNGQEVAFDRGGEIRVVPLQGGVPRTLIEGGKAQPAWSPDGAWIYYRDGQGLKRIPAAGGEEEIITEVNPASGEGGHAFVNVLPGGRKILYQVFAAEPSVRALDLETGEDKVLTLGRYPRYSSTGHLLFLDDAATLLAAPFDVERLELTGAARPMAEQLMMFPNGMGFFAVSEAGRLAYLTGFVESLAMPVWVERDGTAREIQPGWGTQGTPNFSSLALSPNGDRLAISIPASEGTTDLWVKQLPTGPLSRLTFEGRINHRATWSPNGESLRFLSNRAGTYDLWTKRADGSGTAELVLDQGADIWGARYSSDGTWLVLREGAFQLGDIYAIRPGVDSVAVPLEVTEFGEVSISLSPNDRWLAYVSNNTGRDEVYVRPFPPDAGSGLVQVSSDGGTGPVWAHSGRELFYRNGANELVAVQVTEDPTFATVQEAVLFPMDGYLTATGHAMYDVSPDDQSFVMLRISDEDAATELIWVENWAPEIGGTEQVTTGGGTAPRWSRQGDELFYWRSDSLMVRSVSTGERFSREAPRFLFRLPTVVRNVQSVGYDVAPDGRFLAQVRNPDAPAREIHVVQNWFEELRERIGN